MLDPTNLRQIVTQAETAWSAHKAQVQAQVEAGTLTRAEGEGLGSERRKAAWLRQYLLTQHGLSL